MKFRAKNDAHIGLFEKPRRTDGNKASKSGRFYEIVVGGWGNG